MRDQREWGFTKFTHDEYRLYQKQGRLVKMGAHSMWRRARGPLAKAGTRAVLSYELERKSVIERKAREAAAKEKSEAIAAAKAAAEAYQKMLAAKAARAGAQ